MRYEYRISRGRDGRLVVRPVAGRNKRSWRLAFIVIAFAALFGIGNLTPVPGALSAAVVEISESLFEEKTEPPPDKMVIKLALPLPDDTGDIIDSQALQIVAPTALEDNDTAKMDEATETDEVALLDEGESVLEPLGVEDPPTLMVEAVVVDSGDSLYTIFNALHLDQRELAEVTKNDGKQLKRIHPGEVLEFHIDANNTLAKLIYRQDEVHSTHFIRNGSGYRSQAVEEPYERRQAISQGKIDSSLFIAGQQAGLPGKTIMELVEIFGWDVDFVLDIRAGDRFSLIYEELYKDDKKVGNGAILAAEFINQGRSIRALRYTDETGRSHYFSPDGDSMRKTFLRTPVKFSRISSQFGKRKHPILHTLRHHNGVDYAAARSTPVKATGDGRIEFVGRNGGYGKTVIVRHGSTYTTLYAHLSKFAKGTKRGRAIEQGQIIGYVGATGLATGPHLHYEFRVRGVHRDPLKVELPKAEPIAAKYLADFKAKTRNLALRLDQLSRTQIASNE